MGDTGLREVRRVTRPERLSGPRKCRVSSGREHLPLSISVLGSWSPAPGSSHAATEAGLLDVEGQRGGCKQIQAESRWPSSPRGDAADGVDGKDGRWPASPPTRAASHHHTASGHQGAVQSTTGRHFAPTAQRTLSSWPSRCSTPKPVSELRTPRPCTPLCQVPARPSGQVQGLGI